MENIQALSEEVKRVLIHPRVSVIHPPSWFYLHLSARNEDLTIRFQGILIACGLFHWFKHKPERQLVDCGLLGIIHGVCFKVMTRELRNPSPPECITQQGALFLNPVFLILRNKEISSSNVHLLERFVLMFARLLQASASQRAGCATGTSTVRTARMKSRASRLRVSRPSTRVPTTPRSASRPIRSATAKWTVRIAPTKDPSVVMMSYV